MNDKMERQKLNLVIHALNNAGYNPIAQLAGYVETGNPAYITRTGDARNLIRQIDMKTIKRYLYDCMTLKASA